MATLSKNLSRLRNYFSGKTVVIPKPDGKLKLKTVDPTARAYDTLWTMKNNPKYNAFINNYASRTQNRMYLQYEYDLMERDPIISRALTLMSQEACLTDQSGDTIHIETENQNVKLTLEHLFYEIMNIEALLPSWIRLMLKYGDCYLYLNLQEGVGITDIVQLGSADVEREEDDETAETKFSINTFGGDIDEEYIAHFRHAISVEFFPYGVSILEAVRKYWKMQMLLEDFMMVYYLLRSVNQRVFRVDVGALDPNKVPDFIEKFRQLYKKKPLVDQQTGDYDIYYDPMSYIEDIILPVREGYDNTEFDEIPPSPETNILEGIDVLRQKIMAGLGIPNFLLNYEEQINSRCIHPDTQIKLLNGEVWTIKEIADHFNDCKENDKEFNLETYSYDDVNDEIIPSKIQWADITRKNAELVEVELDNGQKIKVTPDHRFLLKGGELKEAQDLESGDSLQAFDMENNHKVIISSVIEEICDTYNMEVDSEFHNYPVVGEDTQTGVFIKNSSLSSEDIRFAKLIESVQSIIVSELEKIAITHLILQGYGKKDILDVKLSLTPPSNLHQMEKYELMERQVEIATAMKEGGFHSKEFIWREIFNMSEDEIDEMKQEIQQDMVDEQVNEETVANIDLEPQDETSEESDSTEEDGGGGSGEGSQGGMPEGGKESSQDSRSGRAEDLLADRGSGAPERRISSPDDIDV